LRAAQVAEHLIQRGKGKSGTKPDTVRDAFRRVNHPAPQTRQIAGGGPELTADLTGQKTAVQPRAFAALTFLGTNGRQT